MEQLIARLEAATGPSFELNAAIARLDFYREEHGDLADNEVPDFCSSIDAALTLVPGGLPWEVSSDRISKSLASVCTTKDNGQYIDETLKGSGPLDAPAIALCIAALRARLRSPAGTPDQ